MKEKVIFLELHDVFFVPGIGQHKKLPATDKVYPNFSMEATDIGIIATFDKRRTVIPWPMVKVAELGPKDPEAEYKTVVKK